MVPPGQFVISLLVSAALVHGPAEAPRGEDPVETAPSVEDAPADADGGAPDEDATPGAGAAEAPDPAQPDAATEAETEVDPTPAEPNTVEPPPPEDLADPPPSEAEAAADDEPLDDPPLEDDEAWDDEESWEDDEEWDDDYDPLRDSPDAVQSQRRIAGGAVLIGVGALTAFGALGMGLSDPCAAPAGNSCSSSARNRAAVTMGLPGVAVLGAGIAVLVVGLRQRDRLRVDAQASRTSAGLLLSGRF